MFMQRNASYVLLVVMLGLIALGLVMLLSTSAELAPMNGDGEDVGRVVRALQDLQRRDPNRYVRMRSAAALRQIGSRDMQ